MAFTPPPHPNTRPRVDGRGARQCGGPRVRRWGGCPCRGGAQRKAAGDLRGDPRGSRGQCAADRGEGGAPRALNGAMRR